MTLETDGNKTHSNEIVEQCYVDARAAEGQSCGECNMERITGGGEKIWSINEKIQGTSP